MEMKYMVAHALVGIAIIVLEMLSIRYLIRAARVDEVPVKSMLIPAAIVAGIGLAAASWFLPMWFGYPIQLADGRGRVIGIPFLVAFFDARGDDYVSPFTLPSAIANAIVLVGVPTIALAAMVKSRRWRHGA
jgi:hypothetical protein